MSEILHFVQIVSKINHFEQSENKMQHDRESALEKHDSVYQKCSILYIESPKFNILCVGSI